MTSTEATSTTCFPKPNATLPQGILSMLEVNIAWYIRHSTKKTSQSFTVKLIASGYSNYVKA